MPWNDLKFILHKLNDSAKVNLLSGQGSGSYLCLRCKYIGIKAHLGMHNSSLIYTVQFTQRSETICKVNTHKKVSRGEWWGGLKMTIIKCKQKLLLNRSRTHDDGLWVALKVTKDLRTTFVRLLSTALTMM